MLVEHNAQTLKLILQQQYPNFAYEVLSLQIAVGNQNQTDKQKPQDFSKIKSITSLIGLYMLAVQVLEAQSDGRYKYFNQKIQTMMTKKHIIQELHRASTGKQIVRNFGDKNNALAQSLAAKQKQRRNQYDLQIFFNKEQFDNKKIKQFLQNADNRYQSLQSSILENLKTQQEKVNERIKKRKMKSERGFNTSSPMIKTHKQPNNIQIYQELQQERSTEKREIACDPNTYSNTHGNHINYVRNRNSRTGLTQKKNPLLKKASQGLL